MLITAVMNELKTLGDPRAIAVWQKLGMDSAKYYGVNLTKLKTYAGKLRKNHELALELWATGIHDARLLATMIADPKRLTEADIVCWVQQADYWDLSDKICQLLVARTAFGPKMAAAWCQSKDELVKRSGYMLIAELARSNKQMIDADFLPYLEAVREEIQKSPNWAKEGMNWALIQIGRRSPALKTRALAVLDAVGPIAVDYGDTSCKTPDARKYLLKEK